MTDAPQPPNFPCPCCGCLTIPRLGSQQICPVCFWQDDGQTDADADVVRGGPNELLSLTEARDNYQAFRASSERRRQFVRAPGADEIPPESAE